MRSQSRIDFYCELPNRPEFQDLPSSKRRRASQTICYRILIRLIGIARTGFFHLQVRKRGLPHDNYFRPKLVEESFIVTRSIFQRTGKKQVPKVAFDELCCSIIRDKQTPLSDCLRKEHSWQDRHISATRASSGEPWPKVDDAVEKGKIKNSTRSKRSIGLAIARCGSG